MVDQNPWAGRPAPAKGRGARDGVAIPKHIESTVDTRVVGRAELKIDYSNFTKPDGVAADGESSANSGSGTQ